MNKDIMKYIIARLIEKANDALEEKASGEFGAGRSEAYYEMLDVLQSEIEANEENLAEYGLDIDISKYA